LIDVGTRSVNVRGNHSHSDAAGVFGRFTGTMVHDRLAVNFNYTDARHAIYGASFRNND